ncbi:hypothetical protein BDN72DRAFT_778736 [Pluteus cervinus]|uniref:Uncharacterized protein n=1 Tax=Pluteus cervinus TaxID=181527 RepID=A0ACD3A5K1_9AGAR|nr:hypothetical protein BDN72DRAFT_778736 [Pluteus cervinus]
MTSITRNFPWFIKDFGVSIIGQECYVSLVEDLSLSDTKCLRYALSKGLGIGLVIGGSIMKLPQLLLIINARSARGLSLTAFSLETLAYSITTAYPFRNSFPFSTYGENFFLSIQNTLITLLIIYYSPISNKSLRNTQLTRATILVIVTALALWSLPLSILSILQLLTLPLSLFSKLPQIRQNARSQSTGQLSAFAVLSQVAGCLARLFTTATETGDWLVAAAFGMALLLNSVLGIQMWMYWGNWDTKLDQVEMGLVGAHGHETSFNARHGLGRPGWMDVSEEHKGNIFTNIAMPNPIRVPSILPFSGERPLTRKVD